MDLFGCAEVETRGRGIGEFMIGYIFQCPLSLTSEPRNSSKYSSVNAVLIDQYLESDQDKVFNTSSLTVRRIASKVRGSHASPFTLRVVGITLRTKYLMSTSSLLLSEFDAFRKDCMVFYWLELSFPQVLYEKSQKEVRTKLFRYVPWSLI